MNTPPVASDADGPSPQDGHPRVDPVPTSAAAARSHVTDLLRTAGIDLDSITAADVLLVTSELVTNAIRHGGGLTTFHTEIVDGVLHLSVGDADPQPPVPRTGSVERPGGYGWPLVHNLSESTRVERHPHGKTIATFLRLT
ncbi:ATP-binding protein [Streptomyces sp. NPDC057939]|uniref:ATP-binding protein n=1 Tax=Streptomyces sp. NPDC057939 TaxID=3346284 RepID=UPI0036E3A0DA